MSVNIEKLWNKYQNQLIWDIGTKLSLRITKRMPLTTKQVSYACYALALLILAEVFVVRISSPFRYMLKSVKTNESRTEKLNGMEEKSGLLSNAQFVYSEAPEELAQENKIVYLPRYHG